MESLSALSLSSVPGAAEKSECSIRSLIVRFFRPIVRAPSVKRQIRCTSCSMKISFKSPKKIGAVVCKSSRFRSEPSNSVR